MYNKVFEGGFYRNQELEAGDILEVVSVRSGMASLYPPLGEKFELVYAYDTLCLVWNGSYRNGMGLTYRYVEPKVTFTSFLRRHAS